MYSLILASNSPRRKQLLEMAEINFSVYVEHIEEDYDEDASLEHIPIFLAEKKARKVWDKLNNVEKENSIVLAADTVVIANNHLIGKPENAEKARKTLQELSENKHKVITGVCIIGINQIISFKEETLVYFKKLDEEQINYYIDKFRPFDKAGAYAIQEWIGLIGIERIEGDYYNVVGLPINKVVEALKKFNLF